MLAERAKRPEGRQSSYAKVNAIDFPKAWKMAVEFDSGLPEEPSEDPILMKRAMVDLARLLEEMRIEWS